MLYVKFCSLYRSIRSDSWDENTVATNSNTHRPSMMKQLRVRSCIKMKVLFVFQHFYRRAVVHVLLWFKDYLIPHPVYHLRPHPLLTVASSSYWISTSTSRRNVFIGVALFRKKELERYTRIYGSLKYRSLNWLLISQNKFSK